MKTNHPILLTIALAGFVAGCRQADQRVPQADAAVNTNSTAQNVRSKLDAAGDTFQQQKEKAQAKMSQQLNSLDAKMAELKAKAQSAGDKAKAEWEAKRPQLEAQRAEASRKLDELKTATKDTWNDVSRKTEAAFGELEKGFKDAWTRLKE